MKRISKLTINNFKAFKERRQFFRFKKYISSWNKRSGKSSVYWTLYTFLQSSVKTDLGEVHKYFC